MLTNLKLHRYKTLQGKNCIGNVYLDETTENKITHVGILIIRGEINMIQHGTSNIPLKTLVKYTKI